MDGDTLIVRDSGFNRTTYSHARDVVGWRVFDMAPQDDKRPPKLSEDFAVSTVERDSDSGSNSGSGGSSAGNAILQQRIVRDATNKRSLMVANGSLVHGYLLEITRCDLGSGSFMFAAGAASPPPAPMQCSNVSVTPDGCQFSAFWDVPQDADYVGQEEVGIDIGTGVAGGVVLADRWEYRDDAGEQYAFWATAGGSGNASAAVPVRIAKTLTRVPGYKLWQIDFVDYRAGTPSASSLAPPSSLHCESGRAEQQKRLSLSKQRELTFGLADLWNMNMLTSNRTV